MRRYCGLILIFILGCGPATPPTADLASPSQRTRDAAAATLRSTVKPPSNRKWLALTRQLRAGENETNVLALLQAHHLSTQAQSGFGGLGEGRTYRLDDYWCLGCNFNNNDPNCLTLDSWKLVPGWRAFDVWPATNFTGMWINYYANGQPFSKGSYTNGTRGGEHVTFRPDGSKGSVWHYDHGLADGLCTLYFSSGRIWSQEVYSHGHPVGVWVTYREDGSTNYVRDYSKR
jgi:hypothetical protein